LEGLVVVPDNKIFKTGILNICLFTVFDDDEKNMRL
jgi:hypothetical protein